MSEPGYTQTDEKFLKLDTEAMQHNAVAQDRRLPPQPAAVHGTSEVAQTALAVLALVAAGKTDHPATIRGVQFLIENQKESGTWKNEQLEFCSNKVDEDCVNAFSSDSDQSENEPVIYSFCQYKKAQERNRSFPKEAAFFSKVRSAVPKLKIFSPDFEK